MSRQRVIIAAEQSVHPILDKERRGHTGGTAAHLHCNERTICLANRVQVSQRAHALRAVRQFAWLEAGSGKVALSRPTHR
jgi:hypothetical protein